MTPQTVVQPQSEVGKWGALRDVLTSANGVLIIILLFVLVIFLIQLVRKGYIKISGKGLQISNSETERNIIRQQIEWTHVFLESFIADLNIDPELNEWRTKYVVERVYDEVVDWITFNHITDKGDYIKIKQEKIWYLVKSLTYKEQFRTLEFKETISNLVQTIITQLIKIRTVYTKKVLGE